MSMFSNSRPVTLDYGTDDRAVFNFFNAVYAWMCVGLGVTAVTAYAISLNPTLIPINGGGPIVALFLLASFAMVWGIQRAAMRINAAVALALFIIYSAFIGFIVSYIFLIYRLESIGGVFVITAGVFGGMSLYGFVTKRDLTSIGSFLIMGVWGLFLATLVNIFWANTMLYWACTYIGLALFIGLTAYDTQRLKNIAMQTRGNAQLASRYAVIGSLMLYLDFINMFLYLLRILGKRR